jgi:hypothetical protein
LLLTAGGVAIIVDLELLLVAGCRRSELLVVGCRRSELLQSYFVNAIIGGKMCY